ITYTSNPGFVGNDNFTYTISDGLQESTATVNVDVVSDISANISAQLNGDASYDAGTREYTLTPDAGFQAGSAMFLKRIDLRQDFDLSFDIQLGDNDAGADGLAFVLHNSPEGAQAMGGFGNALGAYGIENGLLIEFDSYNNGYAGEIANDHTNFADTDGAFQTTPVDLGNIEDGQWHSVQVSWDASSQQLSYSFDGQQAGILDSDISAEYLGGSDFAHFGFGAGTGLANEHKVLLTALSATFEGEINYPPVAANDTVTNVTDTSTSINVLSNDNDVNGDVLTITDVSAPTNGTTSLDDNGTPGDPTDDRIMYTSNPGFVGNDNFTYTISDGLLESTATVNVDVVSDSTANFSAQLNGAASYD
ncbi:MAG: lectin-like domain-containing protein, partial [Desulfobulbia bacterium]